MKKLGVVLLVLGCALLMSTPATAQCAADSDTFCLTQTNNATIDGLLTITVDVGTDGDGNTTLHVYIQAGDDNTGISLKGFDQIAYSDSAGGVDILSVDGATGAWGPQSEDANIDGFQTIFDERWQDGGSASLDLTFHLDGDVDISAVLVHITTNVQGDPGCSIFISNIQTNSSEEHPGCGNGTEVPEPGSLALLGTGLFSAVGVLRRKLRKA